MNKWFKSLIILVLLFFVVFVYFIWQWFGFLNTPIQTNNNTIEFILKKHTPVKVLAANLHKRRIINKPFYFVLLAYIRGETRNLQAGDYIIQPESTPIDLLEQFVQGKVRLHKFTIIPGWTFTKTISALEQNPYLIHTLKNATDAQIMQKLNHPGEIPEGRFLPETYKFANKTTDTAVLAAAYSAMTSFLQTNWPQRQTNLPYTCPYKTLIVASMIEKEAAISKERPIIAGVIVNRLRRKMYLQLDPTVIYGLGNAYNGDITDKDLRLDTPYNTYIHKGLPPTPICMPSSDAIVAALQPVATKYRYFVAKGDGSHVFSETLKEHNIAVRRYILHKAKGKKAHGK